MATTDEETPNRAFLTFREEQDNNARDYLTRVLRATGGERQAAAEIANVNRTHLQKLITKHGIDIPMNPQARARSRCSACGENRDRKGGKTIDGKFVCAGCSNEAASSETQNETSEAQAKTGRIQF